MQRHSMNSSGIARSKEIRKTLGESVRHRRNQLGFSQEQLAERADLHRTYVSDVERGARNVSLDIIQRLAGALEVSMCRLFAGEPTGTNPPGHLVDVLLVEDNADDAELTLRAFKHAHLRNHVDVVSDGAAALDYLFCQGIYARRKPGRRHLVVLLDLNLPKIGGLEVLKRLKENPATSHIEVVVLTVSDSDADITASKRLGAKAYITKPVNFQKLSQATPSLDLTWALLKRAEPDRQESRT